MSQKRPRDLEIFMEEISYDGYQVVRGEFFAHTYEPSFTINKDKVAVNMACIRKLPETDYVQILVNPLEKKLAVRPCSEQEKDSFKWCTGGKKRGPRQITARIFVAKVMHLMDWNPDYRYKLLGKLINSNDQLLFVFDLTTPEIYVRRLSDEAGRGKFERKPTYPEAWQNQFGLPVEKHRSEIQIGMFDGYAVFGLEELKNTKEASTYDESATAGSDLSGHEEAPHSDPQADPASYRGPESHPTAGQPGASGSGYPSL